VNSTPSLFHFTGPACLTPEAVLVRMGIHYPMPPGMVNRPAGTPDHLIMLFHNPVLVWDQSGLVQQIGPALIWWQPGQPHFYGNETASWNHSWIHLEGPLPDRMARFVPCNQLHRMSHEMEIIRILEIVAGQIRGELEPELLQTSIQLLLLTIRQAHQRSPGIARSPHLDPRLLRIRSHLDTHFHETISITRLAGEMSVTPAHLSVIFRQAFGCSPKEYQTRRRMNEALWLIRDLNLTFDQICRRVGYQDYSQFSRLIRKHHGKSPKQLRQDLTSPSD